MSNFVAEPMLWSVTSYCSFYPKPQRSCLCPADL